MASRTVTIASAVGLHARPASLFVQAANATGLDVEIGRPGEDFVDATSILGVMALPTVVSVSEDALQAAGRELREASYALGATRAETVCRTIRGQLAALDAANDQPSLDLLTQRLEVHEKTAWMLRSLLA